MAYLLINPIAQHVLNVDIESYSPIDIKTCGAWRYWDDPAAEVILFGYSLDGLPVQVIELIGPNKTKLPPVIVDALKSPDVLLPGWNVSFEWLGLSKHLNYELPIEKLRDTMLHAAYCGFPLSLEAAGAALNMAEDAKKLSTGKALIRYFSCPCKPTKANGGSTRNMPEHNPEKWQWYIEYNGMDVVSEAAIAKKLSPWPVPEKLQKEWELTLRQNHRGVGIDMDLVRGAIHCYEHVSDRLLAEAKELTGLDNPNSLQQAGEWLEPRLGHKIPSLDKAAVATYLDKPSLPTDARRLLEIRQELSKSSVKKFHAMEDCVCSDGRIHGVTQIYGTHTGRAAGRLIQTQNFPRSSVKNESLAREIVKSENTELLELLYGSVPDTLSSLLRSALVPAAGNIMAACDLASIESRVIAWLAGEEWVLEVFRSHGKIYEATAAMMFGVPFESIGKGSALRQQGKVSTLALGFQGSVGALTAMDYNGDIPDEMKPELVQKWRDANPNIVQMWYGVDRAIRETVSTGRTTQVGKVLFELEAANGLTFLIITIPSGRRLFYPEPHFDIGSFGKEGVFYMGVNAVTRKWEPIQTYGGRAVENIVQATARDIIYDKIRDIEAAGIPITFSVHDEAVADAKADPKWLAEEMERIMCLPVEWAPGLPLGAEAWAGGLKGAGNWYQK